MPGDFREFFDDLPNIPRPEMWAVENIVQAVEGGFTFLIPFKFIKKAGVTDLSGYYILGEQYSCFGVTVGPDHTEIIRTTPEGWLEMTLWFQTYMVPVEAFIGPINENGVGQVWASVDPDNIDWDSLNRGLQIRTKGFRRRRNPYNPSDPLTPDPDEFRKICAWCKKVLFCPLEDACVSDLNCNICKLSTSHGICPPCLAEAKKDL